MKVISGTQVRKELLEKYKKTIEKNNMKIGLAIIQLGDNEASNTYIKNKLKYTQEVGIDSELIKLPEKTTQEELETLIKDLNKKKKVTGIILQSPTPDHIDFTKCARLIAPEKDVDGFSEENLFSIRDNQEKILPCTVKGILKLFDYYKIPLTGKNIVVLGRSNIVGRPLADALINRNATVTICHSKTKNTEKFTKHADIVISAVGKAGLVTKEMVKRGFIGIDVGINMVDGKLVGDFTKEAGEKASYMTPVPGGVGPMTVAMIIDNLIELKEKEK